MAAATCIAMTFVRGCQAGRETAPCSSTAQEMGFLGLSFCASLQNATRSATWLRLLGLGSPQKTGKF